MNIYDILANISPLVMVVFFIICYIFDEYLDAEKILFYILGCLFLIFFILYFVFISKFFAIGYGNNILAIVMQVILLLFWIIIILVNLSLYKDSDIESFSFAFALFFSFIELIYTLYCIYSRLKFENMLDIKWANEIISYIKNIKFLDNISKMQGSISEIIENEWFKGIAITIIGGTASTIIATLILDKRNKNKNFNDKNVNSKNIDNNKKT